MERTTATLRNAAYARAKKLNWRSAALLMKKAIEKYPTPHTALAQIDLQRMQDWVFTWEKDAA